MVDLFGAEYKTAGRLVCGYLAHAREATAALPLVLISNSK